MLTFFTSVRHLGLLLLISLFVLPSAWAWPPTYGAEFEMTSMDMRGYDFAKKDPSLSPEKQGQLKFIQQMELRCQTLGCKVVKVKGKWDDDYQVQYADGWWFKVSYDPGCVEITFKPSSLEVLQEKAAFINDQIFGTGRQAGLTITERVNKNSHVNIGIRSAFDDDGLKFLRFFVDYANHADLALGGLGRDLNNAPPLSVLGQDQREALQSLLQNFNNKKRSVTIAEVAAAIEARVYTRSYYAPWGGKEHYQAVGLKYVNRTNLTQQDAPMELRSVRIQESAEKFNLVARLMEARIHYLNSLSSPIVYVPVARDQISSSELHTRFNLYVEEAGLDPEEFKSLLTAEIYASPVDAFANSRASIEERLNNVEPYWDLIQVSPRAQKILTEIISKPEAAGLSQTLLIKEKMRTLFPTASGVRSCEAVFK